MYRSFSKLLQETQAAAAKRLGALENTLAEDYPVTEPMNELLQEFPSLPRFGAEETSAGQTSQEPLTLREHLIW